MNLPAGQVSHNGLKAKTPAHILGICEGLEEGEIAGMQSWIERLARRVPPLPATDGWRNQYIAHYVLYPHTRAEGIDETTGTPRYWRLSCVGLVLECYFQGAGIQLLDWNSPHFPRISLSELIAIYTDRDILATANREALGLSGSGPWPIALPGYLFYSLQRCAQQIRQTPYLPTTLAETHFPAVTPA
jgi:hypothetical protein